MSLRVVRPSLGRLLCSTLLVAAVSCVITGIVLSIGFILGYNESQPAPKGDYVRLVVSSVTLWGPIYLMTAWWITTPVVIALGALGASLRRKPAVSKSQG